jgi:hypothetical protein
VVVVPRLEAVAAWGAAAEPRQEVAVWDAVVVPRLEVAVWDAAAVPQLAVAAVRQREGRDAAAGELQEAAPDVRVVQLWAALPSVVPWVFRRGQPPPWPAPQPAAKLARAMERSRIATP